VNEEVSRDMTGEADEMNQGERVTTDEEWVLRVFLMHVANTIWHALVAVFHSSWTEN